MLMHYLKTTLRNAARHKLFTFINVFGLALSLSLCLLVIMVIRDQNSFDTFHARGDDIYRVLTNAQRKNGGVETYASSPFPLGEVLGSESPVIERVTHLVRGLSADADLGTSRISVNGFFADPAFFDVFGFTFEKGNAVNALVHPRSLVLTSQTARKLFGDKEAMGATVTLRGFGDFVVTAVLAQPPGKTHLDFEAIGSVSSLPAFEKEGIVRPILSDWNNYYSNYSYVRLREGHTPQELQPLLASVQERFFGELELESRDKGYSFELQPLAGITPGRILSQNLGRAIPEIVLYFLAGLALIGMFAAFFNYTNLTLARSLARAKEIGLRKVVGAGRRQLFIQFLTESLCVAFLSLLFAINILTVVLIPGFQRLQSAEGLEIAFTFDPIIALLFLGFTVLVGLVAGLLPAAVMSGFRPAVVLKDISRVRVFSGLTLRKSLLVLQFSLSMTLMIVLTVMNRQVAHSIAMDYGFDWKNTMSVSLQGQDATRVAQQLSQHPNVEAVAALSHLPLTWQDGASDVRINRSDEAMGVRDYGVDAAFVDQFHLSLVAGENFHRDLPGSNERLILVNERFVERFKLGSPRDAVGHAVLIGDTTEVRITGVVKDFLFKPATYELEPLMLRFSPRNWNVLAVKLRGGDVGQTRAYFESAWKKIDPYHPFLGTLYEDILTDVYSVFSEMMTVLGFLGLLAFVISLLGLLGIVTFQVESRVREVGIRKVLGARMGDVVLLLTRHELTLLLISTIISIPAALWLSGQYLETFAYRIPLGFSVVLPGILVVYFCAGVTVGWQAVRASIANPSEALKYE